MKRIYLYLFLFSLVINVFQYVNDAKVLNYQNDLIIKLQKDLHKANDSISTLNHKQIPALTNDTKTK